MMKHRWHARTSPNIKGYFQNQVWSINPKLKHLKTGKLCGLGCEMILASAHRQKPRKPSSPDYPGASFTGTSPLLHAWKHKGHPNQWAGGSHLPSPAEQDQSSTNL